jgi:hypothetical protein
MNIRPLAQVKQGEVGNNAHKNPIRKQQAETLKKINLNMNKEVIPKLTTRKRKRSMIDK